MLPKRTQRIRVHVRRRVEHWLWTLAAHQTFDATKARREHRMDMQTDSERNGTAATALMGLAAGAIGVWALDRLDWFLYRSEPEEARERTRAVREGGEAPAGVLVSRIEEAAGAELSDRSHYVAELATHYAIGIAPAVAFALYRDKLPISGPARGALFGAALWLLQDEALNPVIGLSAPEGDYPWQDHARALAAHVLFGVATETALNAMGAGPGPAHEQAALVEDYSR